MVYFIRIWNVTLLQYYDCKVANLIKLALFIILFFNFLALSAQGNMYVVFNPERPRVIYTLENDPDVFWKWNLTQQNINKYESIRCYELQNVQFIPGSDFVYIQFSEGQSFRLFEIRASICSESDDG